MGIILLFAIVVSIVITSVKRVKCSDYEFNANSSDVGKSAFLPGFVIGLLAAALLAVVTSEAPDPKATYYINLY